MKIRIPGAWLLTMLLALGCATGGGERAARETSPSALPADSSLFRLERFRLMADSLLADSLLEGANCGVYIVELDSGREVYSRNHESLLTPASVNKLFVAAAALKALGINHRFRTAVCGDTLRMAQGVLKGNLYLKGYGNPDLSKSDLEALAFRLRASGLRWVTGNLVADPSHFDTTSFGYGWMWDEGPYAYNAPISALSLNGNTFELGVRPGPAKGSPVRAEFRLPSSYLALENKATTTKAGARGRLKADREPGPKGDKVKLSGTMPLDGGVDYLVRTVTRPALYCGTVFREVLSASGIVVSGPVAVGAAPEGLPELTWHLSPPLYQIVRLMNKDSDNFTAEMIYRQLESAARPPEGDSLPSEELSAMTTSRLMEVLKKMGFGEADLRMVDGSGLSRYNLCSPEQLVRVLKLVYQDPALRPELLASLPVSGTDGTMYRRLAQEEYRGLVRAKTGTLTGVSSLAGFAFSPGGRSYCFAIMANNYTSRAAAVRAVQDSLLARLLAEAP